MPIQSDKIPSAVPQDRTPRFSYRDREMLAAGAFILPLVLFLAVLVLLPVLGTFWGSLERDVPYLPLRYVGLTNYGAMLRDPGFWDSVYFTVLFVAVSVPLELLLGFVIALVLNERFPGRALLRAAVLLPWAIPAAVSGRIFELIYNYSFGLANYLIQVTHLSARPINWLGTKVGAFAAIVVADAWKTTPFVALLLLAGLAGINQDLYAQGRVDRAGIFQRFLYITVPILKPVLVVALLFRTIDALRVFDVVFVLTGGGPGGGTSSLSMFAYTYFSSGDFGYGAAASVLLFLLALGFSMLTVRLARFREETL
jgi:trehalose/maltose transport system permease protein